MSITCKIVNKDLSKAMSKCEKYEKAAKTAISQAALRDSTQKVPYDTGALRQSGESGSKLSEGKLIWGNSDVVYAAVQYYSKPNKRKAGTCMEWFDAAKKASLSKWINEGKKAIAAVK